MVPFDSSHRVWSGYEVVRQCDEWVVRMREGSKIFLFVGMNFIPRYELHTNFYLGMNFIPTFRNLQALKKSRVPTVSVMTPLFSHFGKLSVFGQGFMTG